ncbi:sulfatase-like hydrolase/transferase [Alienimonas chondri]|uniref:Beta-galactosidase n=1 Tax=Alienimonas chondri TaxID=2681879 RepID=A0ABX1VH26_9PLAN|nr:sulfatase-like hydrolase/transferase [Alienimonas chondri]NNJ27385.1 Beta-galactosidase [Alienimonas chondri]
MTFPLTLAVAGLATLIPTAAPDPAPGAAPAEWAPVQDSMLTEWGEQVEPDSAWAEYPRPTMVRPQWQNLNGLWQYAVTPGDADPPTEWEGEILVPFALEAPLSGVGRRLNADQALWYRTTIPTPTDATPGERTLLHFEAVDYACEVWVNGVSVGTHVGGNLPFSFDVSKALAASSGSNADGPASLVVKVRDATDAAGAYQLRGKQMMEPRGIWYTPVSGIWQTVWTERVPAAAISAVDFKTTIDGTVAASIVFDGKTSAEASTRITVLDDGNEVATAMSSPSAPASEVTFTIPDVKLWSPASPHLYDLKIELLNGRRVVDTVQSYVGVREVGTEKDENGDLRLTLNGEPLFHWGPLDQGWWPDGLLTPPSDEAMQSDVDWLKRAGFNMIRKHIKVEPRRYYAHCDRVGMLVWQDQPSGGRDEGAGEWPRWHRLADNYPGQPERTEDLSELRIDADWPDAAHEQYMRELKGMVDGLDVHPSIVCWVPFNERWGQHRTAEVGRWLKEYDPTRIVNVASGGNFAPVGDIADEHTYPHPFFNTDEPRFDPFVKVVGEFGGHGWPVKGHLWNEETRNWGYGGLPKTKDEYVDRLAESIRRLGELKKQGVAAGIYTQTTDVEGEINGLLTYDRAVAKIPAERLRQIAQDAGLIDLPAAAGRPDARTSALSGRRPNVVVILVDDMGYSDIGCYGGEIETPNLDALAAGGLRFTQFYNQGRCCPTRASLLTGLQPHQAGIGHMTLPPGQETGVVGPYQGYLNDNCVTLAQVLKPAGYRTLMSGKWHLGAARRDTWPLQRGFEKYYGCLSGAINYFQPGGDRGLTEGNDDAPVPDDFCATDTFTTKAIEYLDETPKDEPFFLYLAYNAPHWPLNVKPEDFRKYRGRYTEGYRAIMAKRNERQRAMGLIGEEVRPAPHPGPKWDSLDEERRDQQDAVMAAYAGCLDSIDQNVGRLVSHLRETDRFENTLILFLSDNGACQEGGKFGSGDERAILNPPLETTGGPRLGLQWAGVCNTPYRKYKHFVHEGGARTPCIAHWPAGVPEADRGGFVREYASLQDVMVTLTDLSGAEYPADMPPLQGRSFTPLLAGDRTPIHTEPTYWEHEGNAAVRRGDWKLVREYRNPWELYDMSDDPTELNDLAEQRPELRDELVGLWEAWATETGVRFPKRFNMYEELQKLKSE